jgi:hypothetical protein
MHTIDLNGKKILFIGQVFYDYHTKIIHTLKEEGAEVVFIPNKFHGAMTVSKLDFVGQLRKFFISTNKRKYTESILTKIKNEKFDYLFCIGGFSITPELIQSLKTLNPQIKTIIYFWDSFKVWDHANVINLFDVVFSFDPEDAQQYDKIQYLPLFYTNEYQPDTSVDKDLDILYIGSITYLSKNRLAVLKKIYEFSKQHHLNVFIWAYDGESARGKFGKIHSFFKKVFITDFRAYIKELKSPLNSFIKTETLKRNEIVSLMKRSKCVIDIPVTGQVGLTIRTIETLALNNKLITTNKSIINEKFYDEKFIRTMEESEFELDLNFINMIQNGRPNVTHLELREWLVGMFNNVN